MLKTNSKQAAANIRAYILNNFNPYDEQPREWPEAAAYILDTFRDEYRVAETIKKYHRAGRYISEQTLFEDWAAGLPSILDTCYYYTRAAVDDLGEILEETAEERAKYSEEQAEQLLTRLIYRELKKAERR